MRVFLVGSLLLHTLLLACWFWPGPPANAQSDHYATLNGDANGDGSRDLSDAVYLLTWLFTGGPEPVPFAQPPGRLPATGQTECYDMSGRTADCTDQTIFPGQDGFYQRGCPREGRFVDNGDGTVTDNCTGLTWQQEIEVKGWLWDEALRYCKNLKFAGHEDWRLPNVVELQSLVDYSESPPTLDRAFKFRNGIEISWGSMVWSSTTGSPYGPDDRTRYAHILDHAAIASVPKTGTGSWVQVRAVRGP